MNRIKIGLFTRYLSIVLIPMVVLIVMGAASIMVNKSFAERQIRDSNRRTLEQISNSMDFTFQELDALNVIFSTSSEFLNSLNRILVSPELDFEQSKVLSAIQNFVNVSAYARPYVESIYVYLQTPADRLLTTTDGIVDLSGYNDRGWVESFLAHKETDAFWTETRVLARIPTVEKGHEVITIFRRIYPLIGIRVPGVVVLNIHRAYMGTVLDGLKSSPEQKIEIMDDAGKIVYSDFPRAAEKSLHAGAAGDLEVTVDGQRYYADSLVSTGYKWTYLSYTPMNLSFQVARTLRNINLAIVLAGVLIGTVITFWASRRGFRNIEGVLDIVNAAESGAPMPAAPHRTDKGFGHVTYSILTTFIEHKFLQVQLSERKYRQKTLELLALQSQMNPHFLFNTLETINWKVIKLTRRPNRINAMITSLSNILKYSLQSPFADETLGNEMEHARDYLSIQGIRYKNKFSAVWDCDESLAGRKVLRFLLQPLLENAIYHGIREAEGKRTIVIRAAEANGRLLLSVSDDGLGISPERLQEIRERLSSDAADGEASAPRSEPAAGEGPRPSSIGLFNTNKRIKLAFGEEYGLRVESVPGEGTTVTMELPARG